MKFEIEVYKGQTIEYDDDYDKFLCEISIEDKYKKSKRSSLKDIRKEIDQFVKMNLDFKPFKALVLDEYSKKDFHVREFKAIRTDGKFVVSDGYSDSHWGKKEMDRCYEYDEDLVKEQARIEKLIKDFTNEKRDEIIALTKKLKKMDFSKYEKFINQAND